MKKCYHCGKSHSGSRNICYPCDLKIMTGEYSNLIDKYSAIQKENEKLKTALVDRSEKYRIAMDKGVLPLGDEIKSLRASLREAVEAIERFNHPRWLDDSNFADTDDAQNLYETLAKIQAKHKI